MKKKTVVKNVSELKTFATTFAAELRGGDVVGLIGDLGAGKTTFVQSLAAALGVKASVKSPTFILLQVFETGAVAKKRGVAQLCHVDAYRLKSWEELQTIGFEEFAGNAATATVVEWADRVPELRSFKNYKELTFTIDKTQSRHIVFVQFKPK